MADKNLKSIRFEKQVVPKMNKALKALDALEKFSNQRTYEYTKEQTDKMFEALQTRITTLKKSFRKKKKFKL